MWYKSAGNDNDVVISTRLRLARNFKGLNFPGKMSDEEADSVIEKVKNAVVNSGTAISDSFKYIDLRKASNIQKLFFLEEHLISSEMIEGKGPRGVLTGYDDKISIMINEEDHIRMQCILGGYDLYGAYDIINKIDNIIEEQIDYAFSEKYGYLTKCPTNVGTGMRASVMLHLPGLSITGNISNIVAAVNKLGITVRGLYGEGSQAKAYIYQVSNQVTLGISEEDTLSKLKDVVDMLIEKEREVCKTLYENNLLAFKDKIARAYGVLSNAYVMSSEEFMNLIPYARMGVNMHIIDNIDSIMLNTLLVELQPAHVAMQADVDSDLRRDEKRAEILRERLKGRV